MYVFGRARGKIDRLGRVLLPVELRKVFGKDISIVRIEDKIIIRERRKGSFRDCFDSVKLTNEDLENMEDIIAEGGMMGNFE